MAKDTNKPEHRKKSGRAIDLGRRYLFVTLLNDVAEQVRAVHPGWQHGGRVRKNLSRDALAAVAEAVWGALETLYRDTRTRIRDFPGKISKQEFLTWGAQKEGRAALVEFLAVLAAMSSIVEDICRTNQNRSRSIPAYPSRTIQILQELARKAAGLFPSIERASTGDGTAIVWPESARLQEDVQPENATASPKPVTRVNPQVLKSFNRASASTGREPHELRPPERQFSFLAHEWAFAWKTGVDFSTCRSEKDLVAALERATITSLFKLIFTDLQSRGLRICRRVDSSGYPCGRVFVAKGRAIHCPKHRSTNPRMHSIAQVLKDKERDKQWDLAPLSRRKTLLHEWFPGRADALIDYLQSPEYRPRKRRNRLPHKFGAGYWAMKKLVDKAGSKQRPR